MYQSVMAQRQGTGSSGVGFAFMIGVVKDLNPAQNICLVQNLQTGDTQQVALDVRSSTNWPQVGEQWLLDRSLGVWSLRTKVTDRSAPSVTGSRYLMDPDVAALVDVLAGLGLIADTTTGTAADLTWQTPTLASGWTPFTTLTAPRYKLNRDNTVSIEGRATAPAGVVAGATIFTFPADSVYIPPVTKYDTVLVAPGAAGELAVAPDGSVKIWDFGSATVGRVLFHMRYSLTP